MCICAGVGVCVCERDRDRDRDRETEFFSELEAQRSTSSRRISVCVFLLHFCRGSRVGQKLSLQRLETHYTVIVHYTVYNVCCGAVPYVECVAVCCSVLQCVEVFSATPRVVLIMFFGILQCVAVRCSVCCENAFYMKKIQGVRRNIYDACKYAILYRCTCKDSYVYIFKYTHIYI